uniref:SCAN box domain-containing protein n=1 Tax=Naja naja TaxID=35670 RepID=A0A8C6X1V3_NAJNA
PGCQRKLTKCHMKHTLNSPSVQANREAGRQRFRLSTLLPGETLQEILSRLNTTALQWLCPQEHSKDQIVDMVILEQFLSVLPVDMQKWLKAQDPNTCLHIMKRAPKSEFPTPPSKKRSPFSHSHAGLQSTTWVSNLQPCVLLDHLGTVEFALIRLQAEMPHTPRQRLQPRAPIWSETETRDFLALWGELLILRWIENRPPNSDIYEDLSAQMIARGHERNASQCRNRARDLKRSYRRAKDAQICAGAEPVSCRYFRELDQMFGGEMDRATNRSLASMDGSMRAVVKSEDAKDMEAQASEEESNQMTPPNTLSSMDADTDTETEQNMGIIRGLVTVVDPNVIETAIVEEAGWVTLG